MPAGTKTSKMTGIHI